MVERHIRARGIANQPVLDAMAAVPREALIPPHLIEFAYEDSPLPIGTGQTISQPYIVALMTDALRLGPGDKVLEIGTGSGYAAAVLAEIVGRVYTIERHAELADLAARRLAALGYDNIEVRCGDGTLGWPEEAPFDAIAIAAGGPELPGPLLEQLAVGGRLVMPLGGPRTQELVRVTRVAEDRYEREDFGRVAFVPLIGQAGWSERGNRDGNRPKLLGAVPPRGSEPLRFARPASRPELVARLVAECAEPVQSIEDAPLAPLLDRIGDARVVLLGEATHGTSEFYRMRAGITRELVLRCGFNAVAVEADWPDAAAIDRYVRHAPPRPHHRAPFERFPSWRWRNRETRAFIEWLREYNGTTSDRQRQVSFSGLDLYSMSTSVEEVVRFLDRADPDLAQVARDRYGCLTPWQGDPAAYGRAVASGRYPSCEGEVVFLLHQLVARRLETLRQDGDELLDLEMNARVVAGAERYYRALYYGTSESWNLRDQHMFDCLQAILEHRGPSCRMIVWEHNAHVGDAAMTEMGVRGEHSVGHLCRNHLAGGAYLVGFGTDHGTVAAAHDWEGPMEPMQLRPSHAESYERICHDAGLAAYLLALRHPARDSLREELMEPRLERAIGVIYRPERELMNHYFQAVLAAQFDEYIWFDETSAITPLGPAPSSAQPIVL